MVTHAEGRNRATDKDPLKQVLMLLEQWDNRTVKAVLCDEGRRLAIRNEDHNFKRIPHVTATWWPIDNCGYGMGIGRLNSGDQRINQGVINEALKMIAYPMNAPILYDAGSENAPTQNLIARTGGFWGVRPGPSGDVNKAVGFMKMPDVPTDAWKMLELTQKGGEGSERREFADAARQPGRAGFERGAHGDRRRADRGDGGPEYRGPTGFGGRSRDCAVD